MSDPPDMEDLARRYLDLWQSQMSALAADPQVADTLNRLIGLWTANAAGAMPGLWPGAPAPQSDDRHAAPQQPVGNANAGPAAPGAAPLADASRPGGVDVDELARRLAAVEERIDRLEAGPARARRKPKATTKRRPK
jgi:hypothetical protein